MLIASVPRTSPISAVFFVLFDLYTIPAVKTKTPLTIKFAASPTNPVLVIKQCKIFFTSSIIIPAPGPSASAPISAGKSEISTSRNPPTLIPRYVPMTCSINAAAASIPIFAILLVFVIKNSPLNL